MERGTAGRPAVVGCRLRGQGAPPVNRCGSGWKGQERGVRRRSSTGAWALRSAPLPSRCRISGWHHGNGAAEPDRLLGAAVKNRRRASRLCGADDVSESDLRYTPCFSRTNNRSGELNVDAHRPAAHSPHATLSRPSANTPCGRDATALPGPPRRLAVHTKALTPRRNAWLRDVVRAWRGLPAARRASPWHARGLSSENFRSPGFRRGKLARPLPCRASDARFATRSVNFRDFFAPVARTISNKDVPKHYLE